MTLHINVTQSQTLTFRGLDGYAGFRHDQSYEVEVSKEDDGSGEVFVSMPHAPGQGPARFDAKKRLE